VRFLPTSTFVDVLYYLEFTVQHFAENLELICLTAPNKNNIYTIYRLAFTKHSEYLRRKITLLF